MINQNLSGSAIFSVFWQRKDMSRELRHSFGRPIHWLNAVIVLAISLSIVNQPVLAKVVPTSPTTKVMQKLQQSKQRWLEVRLSKQRLIAWEGNKPVYAIVVSTGKAATPTLKGVFAIQTRYRYARMQGNGYDVPDVPYTMYYSGGYAIHGAYWHDRFGTPVSHGCVNVAVNHARWLFYWAKIGTPVVVHN